MSAAREVNAAWGAGRQLGGVDDAVFQLQPAGFDPGQVEQVVEQAKQGLAAGLDHRQALALDRRQLVADHGLRHADHPVQRRADLVAHGGQEGRLRQVRALGRLPRAVERRMGLGELAGRHQVPPRGQQGVGRQHHGAEGHHHLLRAREARQQHGHDHQHRRDRGGEHREGGLGTEGEGGRIDQQASPDDQRRELRAPGGRQPEQDAERQPEAAVEDRGGRKPQPLVAPSRMSPGERAGEDPDQAFAGELEASPHTRRSPSRAWPAPGKAPGPRPGFAPPPGSGSPGRRRRIRTVRGR